MIRFLAAALVAGFATAASAQLTVLVKSPPAYADGEASIGSFFNLDGSRFDILQRVEIRGSRRIMHTNMVSKDGTTHMRSVADLDNLSIETWTEEGLIRTTSSSCSSNNLYPIVLGKVYECRMQVEVNGNQMDLTRRIDFDWAENGRDGRISGYCGRVEETYPDLHTVSNICYSGDGKWVTETRILSIRSIHKI